MAKKEDTLTSQGGSGASVSVDKGFNPVEFLQETKAEFDKVVWPTRQQLISESLGVILMVILSASLIYLVDNFFNWGAKQVFG
ncbi:MAG: preprotein translocase subunit SecE [Synechococcales bacterium]|jgi:preprotein translocase subunit SecE|nr:preprotein translocase subunit SecE [Cyanobacteria bacterium REEB444]MEB3125133.1 preprotein translocase subunit SecE [Synechococcales bacterium]